MPCGAGSFHEVSRAALTSAPLGLREEPQEATKPSRSRVSRRSPPR